MQEIIKISEINDSILITYSKGYHIGDYAYHLGEDKEVMRMFKKLLSALNLSSIVEVKLKGDFKC